MAYICYCPHCGTNYACLEENELCRYCNHILNKSEYTLKTCMQSTPRESKKIDEILLKRAKNSPEFSEEAYQKMLNVRRRRNESLESGTKQTYTPKCPTCGSPHVKKIGVGEKVISGGLFGLFSQKIRQTFKCESCGYKW